MSDEFYIPPPNTMTVVHDHKPTLFKADGTPLVRQAGFVPGGIMAQTSTVFPQLNTIGKKIMGSKKGGGKKSGGGKRGC
jgi:hypothetical protein